MIPDSYTNVLAYVKDRQFGTRHATLIDPANQTPEVAAQRAVVAIEAGSKLIMIGGSTDTSNKDVHETVVAIQEAIELRIWAISQDSNSLINEEDWQIPVVLFPGGGHALSPSADAITFMMLMNSTDPKFLVQEQKKGAAYLAKCAVEALPTGYVVCSPGGKVGEVGKADLLVADDIQGAKDWALCAQMFGFKILYLEAGSGAKNQVSAKLISSAAEVDGLTFFVGGGIRDASSTQLASKAGADWVVTGTLTENCENLNDLKEKLISIIDNLNQSS